MSIVDLETDSPTPLPKAKTKPNFLSTALKFSELNQLQIPELFKLFPPNKKEIEKLKYWKKYSRWAIENQTPTNLLSNHIEYQYDYQAQMILISPDCSTYAYSLKDNSLVICEIDKQENLKNSSINNNNENNLKLGNSIVINNQPFKKKINLRAHSQPIINMVFSRDSKKLATLASDKILLIWDVQQKKIIQEIPQDDKMLNCFTFSNKFDFLIAGGYLSIRIWDSKGVEIFLKRNAHKNKIISMHFSMDDNFLITGNSGNEAMIKIWRPHSNHLVQTIQHISFSYLLYDDHFLICVNLQVDFNEVVILKKKQDESMQYQLTMNKMFCKEEFSKAFLYKHETKEDQENLYIFLIDKSNKIIFQEIGKLDKEWKTIYTEERIKEIKSASFYFDGENINGCFAFLDLKYENLKIMKKSTRIEEIDKLKNDEKLKFPSIPLGESGSAIRAFGFPQSSVVIVKNQEVHLSSNENSSVPSKLKIVNKRSFDNSEKIKSDILSPRSLLKNNNSKFKTANFNFDPHKNLSKEFSGYPYVFDERIFKKKMEDEIIIISNDDYVATVDGKKTSILIWEIESKYFIYKITHKTEGIIRNMFLSNSNTLLASYNDANEILITDMRNMSTRNPIIKENKIMTLAFSNDEIFLVIADNLGKISFHDIEENKIMKEFNSNLLNINFLGFSFDKNMIVALNDNKIHFLTSKSDENNNEILESCFKIESPHGEEKIKKIQISQNAPIFISSSDHLIKLWSMKDKICLNEFKERKDFRDNLNLNFELPPKFSSINLSSDNRKLVAGNSRGEFSIWDVRNPEKEILGSIGGHISWIYFVKFVDRDTALISKSIDSVKKWRIFSVKSLEIIDPLALSQDGEKILVVEQNQEKVKEFNFCFKTQKTVFTTDFTPINLLYGSEPKEVLVSKYEKWKNLLLKKCFKLWNFKIYFSFDISKACFSNDGSMFALNAMKKNQIIFLFQFTGQLLKKKKSFNCLKNSDIIKFLQFSHQNKYIVAVCSRKIFFWEKLSELFQRKNKIIYEYTQDPFFIEVSPEPKQLQFNKIEDKIVILDTENVIKIMNIKERTIEKKIDHNFFYMQLSADHEFIFLVNSYAIEKFKLGNFESIDKIVNPSIKSIQFSNDGQKIIILKTNNDLSIWNQGFDSRFSHKLYLQCEGDIFLDSHDKLHIVEKNKKILKISNLFENESFIIDNNKNFKFFFDFLNNDKKNENKLEREEFLCIGFGNKGFVLPFYHTFLHLVALTGKEKEFEKFCDKIYPNLIDFDSFFKKDINKLTCLDILFKKKDNTFVIKILNYWLANYKIKDLYEKYKNNLYEFLSFEICTELIKLFQDETEILDRFLNFLNGSLLDNSEGLSLPKLKAPIYSVLEEPEISSQFLKEKLLNKLDSNNSSEYVSVKCLYLPNVVDNDNDKNMQFMKELTKLDPTNPIFGNEVLISLIQYKWKSYGRRKYFLNGLYFIIFLVIFIVQSAFILNERIVEEEKKSYDQISYIFDAFLMFYVVSHFINEIKQMVIMGIKYYFYSFWNLIDLTLFFLVFCAVCLDFLNIKRDKALLEPLKLMNSISMIFCFIRIISYARGVQGSAFMIRLILQVFIDIRYFAMLIIIFIIGLSVSAYDLQSYSTPYSYFKSFNTFYRVMVGDLGYLDDWDADYSSFLYIIFYLASIVLTIVMLNLLIAIISNTYDSVSHNEKKTRIYEMCNIIHEIDSSSIFIQMTIWINKLKTEWRKNRVITNNIIYPSFYDENKKKFLIKIFNENKMEEIFETKMERFINESEKRMIEMKKLLDDYFSKLNEGNRK